MVDQQGMAQAQAQVLREVAAKLRQFGAESPYEWVSGGMLDDGRGNGVDDIDGAYAEWLEAVAAVVAEGGGSVSVKDVKVAVQFDEDGEPRAAGSAG